MSTSTVTTPDTPSNAETAELTIDIGLPVTIRFRIAGTPTDWEICPYHALREMGKQENETDEARWKRVATWLKEKINLPDLDIQRNQLYDLWDLVNAVVEELETDRKKKVESTRSSLRSFLASQTTTDNGANSKN